MGFFKKHDRAENEGKSDNFKMNKGDIEMRNLMDLAFVFQDYETVNQNASFPLKEFKRIKAQKHTASCLEIQLLSELAYNLINNKTIAHKDLDNQIKETYKQYHAAYKSDLLIKFAILASEVYNILERAEQSAHYYQKIASEIQGAPMVIALFYE